MWLYLYGSCSQVLLFLAVVNHLDPWERAGYKLS